MEQRNKLFRTCFSGQVGTGRITQRQLQPRLISAWSPSATRGAPQAKQCWCPHCSSDERGAIGSLLLRTLEKTGLAMPLGVSGENALGLTVKHLLRGFLLFHYYFFLIYVSGLFNFRLLNWSLGYEVHLLLFLNPGLCNQKVCGNLYGKKPCSMKFEVWET